MSWTAANATATYTPYANVYGESARDEAQYRSHPAQDIPREDIDLVRQRQLDDFYRPARSDLSEQNLRRHTSWRGRERSAPDEYRHRQRRGRGRDSSPSQYSSSSYDGEQTDPQEREYFHRNRPQSESRGARQPRYNGDVRSVASGIFDKSANGVFAAALGAGLGAITARRFEKNQYGASQEERSKERWKTVGGAVAGGLLANAAEERFRKHKSKNEQSEK